MVAFAQPSLYVRHMAEILAEDRDAVETRRSEASEDYVDQILMRMARAFSRAQANFFGTPPVPHRIWT